MCLGFIVERGCLNADSGIEEPGLVVESGWIAELPSLCS